MTHKLEIPDRSNRHYDWRTNFRCQFNRRSPGVVGSRGEGVFPRGQSPEPACVIYGRNAQGSTAEPSLAPLPVRYQSIAQEVCPVHHSLNSITLQNRPFLRKDLRDWRKWYRLVHTPHDILCTCSTRISLPSPYTIAQLAQLINTCIQMSSLSGSY